ncbi:MAG: IS110 family transposase [Gammaproteobacteria bacterium]
MIYFGIDISKLTFDVTALLDNKSSHKKFKNNSQGFFLFHKWIKSFKTENYICMEATGVYGAHLASFLVKKKYKTIVSNPYKIKNYARMKMNRNKTDKADSLCIAQYCKNLQNEGGIENYLYTLKSKYFQRLQALVTRLEQVNLLKIQEVNHLESTLDKVSVKFIKQTIKHFEKQIKVIKNSIKECVNQDLILKKQVKLLITIDGIGEITAWSILAYLGDISLFATSGQVTSYAGINPFIENSGTSLKVSRLSKMGHKRLRKSLYMPAIVASKYNPILINFYDKLINKGKPKKVAICAVMRKLLVLSYGVLKSETAFNPNYKKCKAN